MLDKYQVKSLLEQSGVEEEQLSHFDEAFDETRQDQVLLFLPEMS